MTHPLLVLDVVGLTPRAARAHAPAARARRRRARRPPLGTVLPAVTCTVQSTLLTGAAARASTASSATAGTSATWARCYLWRQHNALVDGREGLGDGPPRPSPATPPPTSAGGTRWAPTPTSPSPRGPIYHADGRKSPDCYTRPPALHDELTDELGAFPLFQYWGPTASIASTRWIIDATRQIMRDHRPRPDLAYLPHLDYDLQRFGPDSPEAAAGRRRARRGARARCSTTPRRTGRHRRRARRSTASPRPTSPSTSTGRCAARACSRSTPRTAWSTSTRGPRGPSPSPTTRSRTSTSPTPPTCAASASCSQALPGVDEVLDGAGQAAYGLDHERSGELVAGRRAGRLVHLLLLARRRPGARLRPRRRDPPQARLRPRRAVLRPRRPAGRRPRPASASPARRPGCATR